MISTAAELDALTDEIVTIVSKADDKKAGVAEAQAKLDARKVSLGPKMDEVLGLRGFQVNEESQVKLETSLRENALKLVTLQMDLLTGTGSDPELMEAFNKLSNDHHALLTGRR